MWIRIRDLRADTASEGCMPLDHATWCRQNFITRSPAFNRDWCRSLNLPVLPGFSPTDPGRQNVCVTPTPFPVSSSDFEHILTTVPLNAQRFHSYLYRFCNSNNPLRWKSLWPFCRWERWGLETLTDLIVDTNERFGVSSEICPISVLTDSQWNSFLMTQFRVFPISNLLSLLASFVSHIPP